MFFISHDERFFIKTMRKGEMELLLKLLPRYAAHIAKFPDTLLIKYLGLHRVKPAHGGKARPPRPAQPLSTSTLNAHPRAGDQGSRLQLSAFPSLSMAPSWRPPAPPPPAGAAHSLLYCCFCWSGHWRPGDCGRGA